MTVKRAISPLGRGNFSHSFNWYRYWEINFRAFLMSEIFQTSKESMVLIVRNSLGSLLAKESMLQRSKSALMIWNHRFKWMPSALKSLYIHGQKSFLESCVIVDVGFNLQLNDFWCNLTLRKLSKEGRQGKQQSSAWVHCKILNATEAFEQCSKHVFLSCFISNLH